MWCGNDDHDGVWKLPEGESFYNFLLKGTTTTNLDSNQIHQIGLDEVARVKSFVESFDNLFSIGAGGEFNYADSQILFHKSKELKRS